MPLKSLPVEEPTLNLTPMIDIVFLLIIFFMLTGRLASNDPFPVAAPEAESAGRAEAGPVTLWLAADGRLAYDGAPIEEQALLERLKARAGRGEIELRLKADAGADTRQLVGLLRELQPLEIDNLTLITPRDR